MEIEEFLKHEANEFQLKLPITMEIYFFYKYVDAVQILKII